MELLEDFRTKSKITNSSIYRYIMLWNILSEKVKSIGNEKRKQLRTEFITILETLLTTYFEGKTFLKTDGKIIKEELPLYNMRLIFVYILQSVKTDSWSPIKFEWIKYNMPNFIMPDDFKQFVKQNQKFLNFADEAILEKIKNKI